MVDVPAMLVSLKEMGELVSSERTTTSASIADAGLRLTGNEDELRSAFSNLINNAVRYTPPGGDIRLSWKLEADSPVFAVSDTGEGIAPQHIPRLTERFYRVDTARSRDTGGTGLGLSIVKHILLRHDARLAIDSELGKGSAFRCIFPATRAVRSAPAAAHASLTPSRHREPSTDNKTVIRPLPFSICVTQTPCFPKHNPMRDSPGQSRR